MKEQILKLRSEGKSYREIETILGCSKGTVSFHCGKGQREKTYSRRSINRKKAIQELKENFGGKCSLCDYKKCYHALEFHHPDQNKESDVTRLLSSNGIAAAAKEAEKCVLLCANCHREVHFLDQDEFIKKVRE